MTQGRIVMSNRRRYKNRWPKLRGGSAYSKSYGLTHELLESGCIAASLIAMSVTLTLLAERAAAGFVRAERASLTAALTWCRAEWDSLVRRVFGDPDARREDQELRSMVEYLCRTIGALALLDPPTK